VLLLRFYGQMSFVEIAEEIGCPLGTTLSHCRRGLETLRTLLVGEARP
jgi:DNA-directed RNA polymerase specialized sigma24 family protein